MTKSYFEIVKRTAQHGLDEAEQSEELFCKWLAIWALDVVGEVIEAKSSQTRRDELMEIGDVLWGVAASSMLLGISEEELTESVGSYDIYYSEFGKTLICAASYSELAKKTARDKRKDLEPLKEKLKILYSHLYKFYPVDYCLSLVDEKLMKRYPNGYTAEDSINRVV